MRVDRAGNVSKRHSATDFHFSHVGGACPLWIVYEAFNQPDRILTQIARMPDGRRYFWLARQVSSGPPGMAARARRLPWPWAATCATPTNWCMRAVGI